MEHTLDQLASILSSWGIDHADISHISNGLSNDNWKVEAGRKRYILRRVDVKRGAKGLAFELDYLQKLDEAGFSYRIPLPLETTKGRRAIRHGGECFWAYDYIEGEPHDRLSPSEKAKLAPMMAEYHTILIKNAFGQRPSMYRRARSKRNAYASARLARKQIGAAGYRNDMDHAFRETYPCILEALDAIGNVDDRGLKRYVIHRDLNPSNLLWSRGRLTGILDFEHIYHSYDPLVLDLAPLIVGRRKEGRTLQWDGQGISAFLEGYMGSGLISGKELSLLPDFALLKRVTAFLFRFDKYKNRSTHVDRKTVEAASEDLRWYLDNIDGLRSIVELAAD